MADLNSTLVRGNLRVIEDVNVSGVLSSASIKEGGTALSSKYLGISAKAADSDLLDGHDSSYFINTSNIGSQSVNYATSAGSASSATTAASADYATSAGSANYASSSGNTSLLLYQDTRDAVVSVSDAVDYNGIKIEFKNKASSLIPSSGTWTALITLDGYSDSSGGYPSQLGFSMSDVGADRHLYMRSPVDSSTWGAWKTIAFHGDNISNFNNDNGYVTSSGSVAYASSAGNADTVDNEHASAFAHRETDENLIAHGNEFNFVPSGYGTVSAHSSTTIYFNYRTAGGTNGNITEYVLGNGAGGSLGTIIHTGNISQYASKVEIVDLR